jgi:hypothetical protein
MLLISIEKANISMARYRLNQYEPEMSSVFHGCIVEINELMNFIRRHQLAMARASCSDIYIV